MLWITHELHKVRWRKWVNQNSWLCCTCWSLNCPIFLDLTNHFNHFTVVFTDFTNFYVVVLTWNWWFTFFLFLGAFIICKSDKSNWVHICIYLQFSRSRRDLKLGRLEKMEEFSKISKCFNYEAFLLTH